MSQPKSNVQLDKFKSVAESLTFRSDQNTGYTQPFNQGQRHLIFARKQERKG